MTGFPAALSALAFASTASVADSLMAAMRREIRRSAGGRADVGSVAETAVMGPSCQRRAVDDDGIWKEPRRRWELDAPPARGCGARQLIGRRGTGGTFARRVP